MSMAGDQRLQTVLNAPSSVKKALAHVRVRRRGALCTVLNPSAFEAMTSLTTPAHASVLDV